MKYSILKDDTPENTVLKIKNILKSLNIELKETIYCNQLKQGDKEITPIVIVRLESVKPQIGGTNGKGTSVENAKASAYAEFMERLQNFILFESSWTGLISLSKDRLKSEDVVIAYKQGKINNHFKQKIDSNLIYKSKNVGDYTFLPFYSVKEQKVCNLPYEIISFSQGSNGMSAGNTKEEAIVQGLSEICERYALKEVYLNNISLATIPEEEYIKYDKIKQMIDFYKENGFKVFIKDASLGGKLPVICTVFEKDGIICPAYGAHPSLPIAIERTLTEFAQGINPTYDFKSVVQGVPLPYYSKEKFEETSIEVIAYETPFRRLYFEMNDVINSIFYSEEPTYKYNSNAWIKQTETITNKKLLKFILNQINYFEENIYIRDVSFLGFPSVYICIPLLSEQQILNKKNYSAEINAEKWLNYYQNKEDKEFYNTKSLLNLTKGTYIHQDINPNTIYNIPKEYTAFLCSVLLKDSNGINKYLNIMLGQNKVFDYYEEDQIVMFNIINDYFKLYKRNQDEKIIVEKLEKKYKKREIKSTIKVIKGLTFEEVASLSLKRISHKKSHTKRIASKILKLQEKNLPNQMGLKKIFENL